MAFKRSMRLEQKRSQVGFYPSDELRAKIELIAKRERISLSAACSQLLEVAVERAPQSLEQEMASLRADLAAQAKHLGQLQLLVASAFVSAAQANIDTSQPDERISEIFFSNIQRGLKDATRFLNSRMWASFTKPGIW